MKFKTITRSMIVVAYAVPMVVSGQINVLSEDEKKNGWKLLFDGKSFEGWRNYKEKGVRKGWSIEDGIMKHTKGGKDLMTVKQYEDFEFKLEWKISEGGNSGIFVGAREINDKISRSGIEMQIIDNEKHPDAQNEKNVSGACYGLYKPPAEAAKKAGEWNQVHIIKKGSKYQFFQNGVKTADFDLESVDFINLISEAKFKDWPHFARYRKGHIGLQDHKDVVFFKNIKLKELTTK